MTDVPRGTLDALIEERRDARRLASKKYRERWPDRIKAQRRAYAPVKQFLERARYRANCAAVRARARERYYENRDEILRRRKMKKTQGVQREETQTAMVP